MKCPECNGQKITAIQSHRPLRGAVEYRMECKDCEHKWSRHKGRHRREDAERIKAEWANVEFVPSRFQQECQERSEKVDRGECPKCSAKLETWELGRDERNISYQTDCLGGCGFKIEGTCDIDYWERKRGNANIKKEGDPDVDSKSE